MYGLSSGGSLSLLAPSRGVPMKGLAAVMEPPSQLPDVDAFVAETESKVTHDQNVEAVQGLWAYQGMPPEVVAQMAMYAEACAPYARTIPVDLQFANPLTPETLTRVTTPTLAVASQASPPLLRGFAEYVAEHVPSSNTSILDGDWHGVPDDDIARSISRFMANVN